MKPQELIICILFYFLVFSTSIIYAQEAKVDVEHVGFGKTPKEAYFSVFNTGDVDITDVTFFVDGEKFKTISGLSTPGNGFQTVLYLEPDEHLIEVRTPEGAYDSLKIKISSTEERPPITLPKEKVVSFIQEKKVWIVIVFIIIIFVIVWLLLRKPKIKL